MLGPREAMSESRAVPASSIWLMPTSEWLSVFQEVIGRISGEFQTERFEPHLTVLGDIAAEADELRDVVTTLAAGFPPSDLIVVGVEGMDLHFRALYLRMVDHPWFDRLCSQAAAIVNRPFTASPYPHLSLAYGRIRADLKRELSEDLRRRFRDVQVPFDGLALVRASSCIPVGQWSIAHRQPLRGSGSR